MSASTVHIETLDTSRHGAHRWRKPLLSLHIVSSVGVLGADLVLLTLGVAGVGDADPRTVYPAMSLIASWVMAPLALIAFGTGLVQAVLSRWGLLRYWWVTIKLAIAALLVGVVLFLLVPGLASAADAATGGAAVLTGAQRLVYVLGPSTSTALLVLSVVLAVYKPSRRLRRGRNEGSNDAVSA